MSLVKKTSHNLVRMANLEVENLQVMTWPLERDVKCSDNAAIGGKPLRPFLSVHAEDCMFTRTQPSKPLDPKFPPLIQTPGSTHLR